MYALNTAAFSPRVTELVSLLKIMIILSKVCGTFLYEDHQMKIRALSVNIFRKTSVTTCK